MTVRGLISVLLTAMSESLLRVGEILSTGPAHRCYLVRNCTTADDSGTSMAAPVVSGVVARMKSRFPKASVGEIRQALYTTARQPRIGPRPATWTKEYGWGDRAACRRDVGSVRTVLPL